MPMQREIHIPQAMQRHTGCAWVNPARAEKKTEKPKPEMTVAVGRNVKPGEEAAPSDVVL
jgi:hypothetical protein